MNWSRSLWAALAALPLNWMILAILRSSNPNPNGVESGLTFPQWGFTALPKALGGSMKGDGKDYPKLADKCFIPSVTAIDSQSWNRSASERGDSRGERGRVTVRAKFDPSGELSCQPFSSQGGEMYYKIQVVLLEAPANDDETLVDFAPIHKPLVFALGGSDMSRDEAIRDFAMFSYRLGRTMAQLPHV